MTNQYTSLRFQLRNHLASITLDRPDAANGLDVSMSEELLHAARRCAADRSVKVVVLTGSGRFFSAGGDIKAMSAFGDDLAEGIRGIADNLHLAMSTFARMEAPLIVSVNGTAAGAGFSLAIAGDLVIAAETAKFTLAYSKIGLSPDGGSSYYLPRLIGLRKTQELMFTNPVLTAQEALDWGLISKVVAADDLPSESDKLAEIFVHGAKTANGAIKNLLRQTFDNQFEAQLELESRAIGNCAAGKDGIEGIAAFLQKRRPSFV